MSNLPNDEMASPRKAVRHDRELWKARYIIVAGFFVNALFRAFDCAQSTGLVITGKKNNMIYLSHANLNDDYVFQ